MYVWTRLYEQNERLVKLLLVLIQVQWLYKIISFLADCVFFENFKTMFSIYAFDKKWYRYIIISHVEKKQVFFTFRKLVQFINIGMRISKPVGSIFGTHSVWSQNRVAIFLVVNYWVIWVGFCYQISAG